MTCYIISYELKNKHLSDQILDAIKSYPKYAQIFHNTWAVVTDKEATDIRDHLKTIIAPDEDRIFIIKSGAEAGWANVVCEKSWLHKYLMNEY
jgi:hypothetical protein